MIITLPHEPLRSVWPRHPLLDFTLKIETFSGSQKPSSGLSKQSANPNIEASQRGAPFPIIPENLNLMLLELALLNKQIDL